MQLPHLVFASPRKLPRANRLQGRVVVLDVAFAAEGMGRGFAKTTGKFIENLGPRLACWVDHHDHPRHSQFAGDERFVLCRKQDHGACPEMISPELVQRSGPIDTIVAHFDLDGIYAAAKWILQGKEPYPGADDDARAIDTRQGQASPVAMRIDQALRAHYIDPLLKIDIVKYLVSGMKKGRENDHIDLAHRDYLRMEKESQRLSMGYQVDRGVAVVTIPSQQAPFDKTELLLLGQKIAEVSVVVEAGNVSIAAAFDSGLDFVELLDLGGGMPTRVSIPEKRLPMALDKIHRALEEKKSATS